MLGFSASQIFSEESKYAHLILAAVFIYWVLNKWLSGPLECDARSNIRHVFGRGASQVAVPKCPTVCPTLCMGDRKTIGSLRVFEEKWCGWEDSNFHGVLTPQRPQRCASTSSATAAHYLWGKTGYVTSLQVFQAVKCPLLPDALICYHKGRIVRPHPAFSCRVLGFWNDS